jgi:hypothetical protein
MVSGMVLEMISPEPLSLYMIVVALAPALVVGIVINYQRWRLFSAGGVADTKQAN